MCRLQVSVVLFVSPVWVFVGRALLPLHERVGRLLSEARFLQVFVHLLFLHLRVMRPNFGNDGVLPLVIFYGHAMGRMFLDGVFDLVELLAHVIGGIVLCC